MIQGIVKIWYWNKNNSIEDKLSRKKGWAWRQVHLCKFKANQSYLVTSCPQKGSGEWFSG